MTERESLPVDVLVVGAGPAGLCFAIALGRHCQERGLEKSILVLDKASEPGHHILSGAVLDPRALLELFPHALEEGFPVQSKVTDDALWWLRASGKIGFRGLLLPRNFQNHGKWILSASAATTWLAEKADALDAVDVYHGFAAAETLYDPKGKVIGVRTVDQGRNAVGEKKPTFEPGMDILADLVVFAEGTRGSLTKSLVTKHQLDQDRNPQIYGVGVKEIWEVPHDLEGSVIHTGGWPLQGEYGGGWIYGLPDNRLSLGFVVGMDHGNVAFDYHAVMQRWKTHPAIASLLDGGKMLSYGAKSLPEGGLFSMPRPYGDGFLLVGDAGGWLNSARLKGIHLAMKSGMLAAETAAEALATGDFSALSLASVEDRFQNSWAGRELHQYRNFRQGFQKGWQPLRGMMQAALVVLTRGALPVGRQTLFADHELYTLQPAAPVLPHYDGKLTFDKLTDVYHSDTRHEEDQPCHLVVLDSSICVDRCTSEYGNPCQHFCPASVYEWSPDSGLAINFSNCVHCKTCDVADPYQIIQWVVPEGGGPVYSGM